MDARENFLRALRRDNPEWVPFEFVLCPKHEAEFERRTGTRDYLSYYNFPIRYVQLNPTRRNTDFTKYYKNLPKGATPISWNPEWGVMGAPGSVAHFQEILSPMEGFTSIEEIEEYPFPDFNEQYRWDGVCEQTKKIVADKLVSVAFMQMTIFEVSWYLRGMDNLLVDMVMEPEFAGALLDKVTSIRIGMAEKYAAAGTDILMLGDDVSTQRGMMMNPDLWRDMLKPRLKKVISAAKNVKPDILIFYHGDGDLSAIIPDLIEIGVEILNPVQPECMDPFEIKRLYGDSLAFWGTLGTQTTLPFGTAQSIEQCCKKLIAGLARGGGLILAPTHMVEPEVPFANLEAFITAVTNYGKSE